MKKSAMAPMRPLMPSTSGGRYLTTCFCRFKIASVSVLVCGLCYCLTRSQMYGTVTSAKPDEKFATPTARVRSVGGYWNVVNVGRTAFATPVVLFTANANAKRGSTNHACEMQILHAETSFLFLLLITIRLIPRTTSTQIIRRATFTRFARLRKSRALNRSTFLSYLTSRA